MPNPRDWLRRSSPKCPILCRVGRETLTQSSPSLYSKSVAVLTGVCLCVLAVAASVLIAAFSHDNGTSDKTSTSLTAADVLTTGASGRSRQRGASLHGNTFEKALQRHRQATLGDHRPTVNSRPRHSGGFDEMIRKFSGLRPTVMSTTGSGVNTSLASLRVDS